MFISKNGLNLIKEFEGCKLKAYDDYNNNYIYINDIVIGTLTIGYGHVENVYKGQTITQCQADDMLINDMVSYCDNVNDLIEDGTISFEVNQNMFDSLTSFGYNLGKSNLVRLCKNRNYIEVAEHMTAYINKGSVWEEGLLRRRNAEKDLFLTPCENVSRETCENVSRETYVNERGIYMSKKYENGSTPEDVFSDINLKTKIGCLNPYETCEAIADVNGRIVVLYDTPIGKKTGFTEYRGGL